MLSFQLQTMTTHKRAHMQAKHKFKHYDALHLNAWEQVE